MAEDVHGDHADIEGPVRSIPGDDRKPKPGIGVCLSGGGYRAMLFHVGSLWRLFETGILTKVDRFSSVSGGSITAAAMALNWKDLADAQPTERAAFEAAVVTPVRHLAGKTIDAKSIVGGIALFGTIGDRIARAYEEHIFGKSTLQDLPERPRFVINATNVQTGALWRFSRHYMGDYRVGRIPSPAYPLARAVAASSAFPPFLSPVTLDLDAFQFDLDPKADLQREPYTTEVVLSDGGVYDNLGLETVYKRYDTILVSDGGGKLQAEEEPEEDWAQHAYRVLNLVDNQVRSLRKRHLIDAFQEGARKGTYWGMRTPIADYATSGALPCPFDQTMTLARTPTRLKCMDAPLQERLINWGYAVTDAAVRRFAEGLVADGATGPAFPYPNVGVG